MRFVLASLGVAVIVVGPAAAQTVAILVAAADLASEQGRADVFSRVESVARRACSSGSPLDVYRKTEINRCEGRVRAEILDKIGDPRLTALESGAQTAAAQ